MKFNNAIQIMSQKMFHENKSKDILVQIYDNFAKNNAISLLPANAIFRLVKSVQDE
jgi:hypothetical protein